MVNTTFLFYVVVQNRNTAINTPLLLYVPKKVFAEQLNAGCLSPVISILPLGTVFTLQKNHVLESSDRMGRIY